MKDNRRERNIATLCGLALVAILYSGWLASHATLTGTRTLDGVISVLLGLYICSHPAANAVDLLFFQHDALREAASEWSGIGWLALNMLVLLLGWIVIFMGTTRLVGEMPRNAVTIPAQTQAKEICGNGQESRCGLPSSSHRHGSEGEMRCWPSGGGYV